ncbi:cation:proton antiporter [Motiliproteus sediminis]|uniref:cation:proton antiporter n=1 Tax=Motiliproteus sediminis TaxID=1468178 RepID=UPI001AEFA3DD|nr:cation:proton antiporter [Motiliproteus sediminis]
MTEGSVELVLLIVAALLLGALTRYLIRATAIPYSVALLALGLLVGVVDRIWIDHQSWPRLDATLSQLTDLDPHLILFLFLPILIFESAYSLQPHLLRRTLPQIVWLAVPGMLICALLTALMVRWLLPWDWSWPLAFMFGALISATDPVAVVALLREVSSRKRLETLLEGESLFNDGTAIVVFTLCFGIMTGSGMAESVLGWWGVPLDFLRIVVLGAGVGYLIGRGALFFVSRIYNDPLLETTISIAVAYLAFFAAEALHTSGVVAVVALGILVAGRGRASFSPEAVEFLHHFWGMLAHLANTLIFLIVGLLIADRVEAFDAVTWWWLLLIYAGLQLIRATAVWILGPVLRRQGVGLSRDKQLVLCWGGLRGAVALALALIVAREPAIGSPWGEQVLFLTAGIVALTILINGSTLGWLFRRLGIDRLPRAKLAMIEQAEDQMRSALERRLPELRKRSLTELADWEVVKQRALAPLLPESDLRELHEPPTSADLDTESRRRLLEAERQSYWQQYRDGYLGRVACMRLIELVERALDGKPQIHPRDGLEDYGRATWLARWLHRVPALAEWGSHVAYRHLLLSYDVLRGYIHAQNEVLEFIPELAPDDDLRRRLREQVLLGKREGFRLLAALREGFPEIARRAETHSAFRTLLIQKKFMIEELRDRALLDDAESDRLLGLIKEVLHQRHHLPLDRSPFPDPHTLLRDCEWTQQLSDTAISYLADAVEQRIYEPGEVILSQGLGGDGLIIIARGTVERVHLDAGDERTVDLLGPGSHAGINALLEGFQRTELRALSAVDLLWIPRKQLAKLITDYPPLKESLEALVDG